jgi:hypothetical protein
MDFPLTLVKLAGSVALLLWGVHMVQSGVQRAFGAKLRSFLSHALRSRIKAFLAGIYRRAVAQSYSSGGRGSVSHDAQAYWVKPSSRGLSIAATASGGTNRGRVR